VKRLKVKAHGEELTIEVNSSKGSNVNILEPVDIKTGKRKGRCHFCDTGDVLISFMRVDSMLVIECCSVCLAVWQMIPGQTGCRMQGQRGLPQTEYNDDINLCPYCWNKMLPDYNKWLLVCPNHTCHYHKKMEGLNMKQRAIMKEYRELKQEVFKTLSAGDEVSNETLARFKDLQKTAKYYESLVK